MDKRDFECRVQYDDDGLLDEVVTDAGMHLERVSKRDLVLLGHRSDGSCIALHITGRVALVEEWPAEHFDPADRLR